MRTDSTRRFTFRTRRPTYAGDLRRAADATTTIHNAGCGPDIVHDSVGRCQTPPRPAIPTPEELDQYLADTTPAERRDTFTDTTTDHLTRRADIRRTLHERRDSTPARLVSGPAQTFASGGPKAFAVAGLLALTLTAGTVNDAGHTLNDPARHEACYGPAVVAKYGPTPFHDGAGPFHATLRYLAAVERDFVTYCGEYGLDVHVWLGPEDNARGYGL